MADENDIVTRVGAHIEESAYTALDLLDTAKDKVFDLTDSVSGLSGIISSFISQTERSNDQLSEMQRKHASLRQQLLLLTGVFSAATVATTKFVKSVFDTETSLRKMAKQQRKSVEAVRASDTALQSMGKTLKEVRADKELNATYKELVNINKEIQLPNIERGMDAVKGLQAQFWKLKDLAKYAIDSIGMRVLNQLEEPIKRITDRLGSVAKWLQNNLDSLTMKLSSGLSAFIKGVDGIARGVVGIIDKVNQIDPAIRKIGTAILAVFALLKSGPLGQIMALVTFIGGIIDDLDNYRYNKRYGLTAENPEGVDEKGRTVRYVETALTGVWDIFEDQGKTGSEKVGSIFDLVLDTLIEKLDGLTETLSKINIWDALFGTGENGSEDKSMLGTIMAKLDDPQTQTKLQKLGGKVFDVLSDAFTVGGEMTNALSAMVLKMFSTDSGLDQAIENGLKNNSITVGLGAGLIGKLLGLGNLESIAAGLFAGLGEAKKKARAELSSSQLMYEDYDNAYNEKVLEILGIDVTNLAGVLEIAVKDLLNKVDTISSVVGKGTGGFLAEFLRKLFGDNPAIAAAGAQIFDSDFWDIFVTGGAVGAATGNQNLGIFAGFATAISKFVGEEGGLEKLKTEFAKLKEAVLTIWYGSWSEYEEDGLTPAAGAHRLDNGLRKVLEPAFKSVKESILDWLNGDDENEGVVDKIAAWFDGVGEKIWEVLGPGLAWVGAQVAKWASDFMKDHPTIAGLLGFLTGQDLSKLYDENEYVVGENGQVLTKGEVENSERSIVEKGNILSGKYAGQFKDSARDADLLNVTRAARESGILTIDPETGAMKIIQNPFGNGFLSGPMNDDWESASAQANRVLSGEVPAGAEAKALFDAMEKYYRTYGTHDNGLSVSEQTNAKANLDKAISDMGKVDLLSGASESAEKLKETMNGLMPETLDPNGTIPALVEEAGEAADEINKMEPEMKIDGDASKAIESANRALREIKSKKGVIPLLFSFAGLTFGEPELYGSQGGRFNDPTDIQIGEDGPEYLIPINKPNRAANLIKQMFGEMGSATAKRVLDDLGIGAGQGFVGGSYSSLASLTGGNSSITTNNNVQAPVNIYVTASGVSAEDVGARAYDAAQRQMLRTLKGVFA